MNTKKRLKSPFKKMAYGNIISTHQNTLKKLLKIIFQKTNKAHLYLVSSISVKYL